MTGNYIIHNIDVCHQVNHRLQVPTLAIMLTFYIGFPVVWSDGRTYGHVITKISRMNRLPNFLRYGAQLASASRARGAPLSCNFCHFLKSAPTLLDDEFEDSFVHLYSVPCTD